jgi:hypothetical protein
VIFFNPNTILQKQPRTLPYHTHSNMHWIIFPVNCSFNGQSSMLGSIEMPNYFIWDAKVAIACLDRAIKASQTNCTSSLQNMYVISMIAYSSLPCLICLCITCLFVICICFMMHRITSMEVHGYLYLTGRCVER